MTSDTIQINDDFDVSLARNVLRRKVAEQNLKPTFRARAAATLTAMGRLLLAAETQGSIHIAMADRSGMPGIKLECRFAWPDNRYLWLDEARTRLSRVSDELEISDTEEGPCITVWVWLVERGRL
ncbi:MAG: hypothetical protein JXB47_07140 [Anaerolineae bacterium]|nr:hypothetical protein [Anaerolineae bacterium]